MTRLTRHLPTGTAALVVAAALSLTAPSASAQWVQFTTGPGATDHYYRLTTVASSWTDARANAAALGGYLVTIGSADENAFLVDTFLPTGDGTYWIGLRRIGAPSPTFNTNGFVWDDGEPLTYTDWYPGEPDNHDGVGPDPGSQFGDINWFTAHLGAITRGQWGDAPNQGIARDGGAELVLGIVEADALPTSTVPEPTTGALLALGVLAVGVLARRGGESDAAPTGGEP